MRTERSRPNIIKRSAEWTSNLDEPVVLISIYNNVVLRGLILHDFEITLVTEVIIVIIIIICLYVCLLLLL